MKPVFDPKLQDEIPAWVITHIAEVCGETLRRIREGEPVSDRYVLGLAWTVRVTMERHDAITERD